MSKNNFNNDIYDMYVKEYENNLVLLKENKTLKLDNANLKYELDYMSKSVDNKIKNAVDKATTPLIIKNNKLKEELNKALEEIDRLKKINDNKYNDTDKDYLIDKLSNQVTKDSTNSSIPTSKEINRKHEKTGANIYNNRQKSTRQSGGQFGHKGNTLTKNYVEKAIKEGNAKIVEVTHYINGNNMEAPIIKYRVGVETTTIIEKHIFIKTPKSKNILPKEFYSDVTYTNGIKTLINSLGNYLCISYNKIKEFISDITNNIINISEGTIDNIYEEFSNKTTETLKNITNNILNGKYQHTDETVTKENGKDTYYRAYANPQNVLYKYHHHKGDAPIIEDNILPKFYGTIISDHDTTIFKYGIHNQDCIVHIGRYCIEQKQNVDSINWPIQLYHFLLRINRNIEILKKYGRTSFTKEEIEQIEKGYDDLLNEGKKQNVNISSKYWKEKADKLLRRLIKYKNSILFFMHDFDIPYDNNFVERALRMIKGKTKVSGGFRSSEGAIRYGNIMSVIKTAKLRKMNPFECMKAIYDGKELFV